MKDLEQLQYPIGHFLPPTQITADLRQIWLSQFAQLPYELDHLSHPLSTQQLQERYRPGGWTVTQVIHHLADSHLNAYTRIRLTLTEDNPVIRPYEEALWAELTDARQADISLSVNLLKSIHGRTVILLNRLTEGDFERCYIHPEQPEKKTLAHLLGIYAWHGRHHLAHIRLTLK